MSGNTLRGRATTTHEAETRRQTDLQAGSLPTSSSILQAAYGKITKIDSQQPLVQIVDLQDGTPLANGGWVPLNHSVREIAERWGKVRKGMVVYVQFSGQEGGNATATIIKEKGESVATEKLTENIMSRGLYKIFSPGVGIG